MSYKTVKERKVEEKQADKQFRMKEFQERSSLLTILFSQTDLSSLRNFFCAIFFLLFLKTIFEDSVHHGNPMHHLWLIIWNFNKLPITLIFWSLLAGSTLFIYYTLRFWSNIPCKEERLTDFIILLSLYILYLCGLFYCCIRFTLMMQLECACTFIVTCESTRISMKIHSFVREVYSLAVRLKIEADKKTDGLKCDNIAEKFPTLEQYAYFFFCPSLVFRQIYPRNSNCNWNAVKNYAQEIIIIIYCVDLIFIQMILPPIENVDLTIVQFSTIVSNIFISIIAGALCLLLLFYGLLHCWLNMFAELLRYSDRQFYLNWWSSKSMAEYYRFWNLVVYEWLYAYIYKDISQLVGGKKGLFAAQTMVFFFSSLFHEYWFGLALRMFYPIIFTLYFIFGGIFYFISQFITSKRIWNIAMYTSLLIGTGMFVSLYSQEWYARQRCLPYFQNSLLDFFIPRHWFCRELKDT
ncbi:MBOAT membrane-bound O-acyltransferase family protein [Acanthocheilonema viteae]